MLPSGFEQNVIGSNIGPTTAVDALPDGRILVATQAGSLRIAVDGQVLPKPALKIAVDSFGERGLIGVTHDPRFLSNHFIYIYHTVPAAGSAAPFNEVTRFTLRGNVVSPSSRVDILKLNDLGRANHNGGAIHFGTDGMLYIGVGENAVPSNSQSLKNLLGKVLRIDVSRTAIGDPINDVAKLIPADNPFVRQAKGINQAIYALGFRNPFTFGVNSVTGEIFIDDVGESTWEEIDKLVPGGNYGWHHAEGFATSLPVTGLGAGTYQDPQLAYNHHGGPAGGGHAIVGGVFYEPAAGATDPFPASFDGQYFYADYGLNWMRVFDPSKPGTLANPDTSSAFATGLEAQPTGMAQATDGTIYYAAQANGGELVQIFAKDKLQFTQQPASQSVSTGQTATFSAQAIGVGTLKYQWQVKTPSSDAFLSIPGGNSASYTLTDATSSQSGDQFRLEVISGSKHLISQPVTLSLDS